MRDDVEMSISLAGLAEAQRLASKRDAPIPWRSAANKNAAAPLVEAFPPPG